MVATVEQLAALVRGRLVGDGSVPIHSARPVGEAGPGDITFIENERYAKMLRTSPASAAIVGPHFKRPPAEPRACRSSRSTTRSPPSSRSARHLGGGEQAAMDRRPSAGLRRADGPDRARTSRSIRSPTSATRPWSATARRSTPAPWSATAAGSAGTSSLHPNAVLYDDVILGDRVEVHAGTVLGGDGFGYRLVDGRHVKIPQTGRVEVGDDVEIGANCTIDRATFEATRIGEGTKIDNLVMIGHNNQIGRHNLLCGQVGIAGSCKTGDYVVMAGQAGIKDKTEIGDRVIVGAQAGVHRNIPAASRSSARRRSRSASSGGSSR